MATLKFKTYKGKRRAADGMFPVYLSVYHRGDVRLINTDIYIPDTTNLVNDKILALPQAAEMNAHLDQLMNMACGFLKDRDIKQMTSKQVRDELDDYIRDRMDGVYGKMTISGLFDWRISNLRELGNESYAKVHEDVKKVILAAVGDLPLEVLDRYVIRDMHTWMEKKGYTPGGIAMKMAKFKAALHEAEMDGRVQYLLHPFAGYKMQKADVRQLDLTLEEFHKLLNHQSTSKRVNFARDIFLLSFYFYGMNIADLLQVTFRNGKLDFVRTKTRNMKTGNKNIMLSIPAEARDVIGRITDGTRVLWPCKAERADILSYVNRGFRMLRAETGIETKLSTYSARKTFSQYAFVNGVDINTIKYCIGQSFESDMAICNGYRIMQRKADMAMSRVCSYVNSPVA